MGSDICTPNIGGPRPAGEKDPIEVLSGTCQDELLETREGGRRERSEE